MIKKLLAGWVGRYLLFGIAIQLISLPALSAPADYSMQMPKAKSSLLLDLAVAGSRLVAVGERGHILYSEDDGSSWVQAVVPVSTMLTRVFFANAEHGWAVGHDGNILFSNDGGVTWEIQRYGIEAQARVNEENAGRAKEKVEALRERLTTVSDEQKEELMAALEEAEWALDDAQITLDDPVFPPPIMDVWFVDDQIGWASGAYGTLLHTANGGRNWEDWSYKVGDPEKLHLNGVVGVADGTLFLASEWGKVLRSSTGGETWEMLESGYEGSFFGIEASPSTGSIFAYGLLGTIYRSTDNGNSWTKLTSKARASLFGAHASDDGHMVFVGQGGTVTRSIDDGDSFQPLVQTSRRSLYGITRKADGRYFGSGDGGVTKLVDSAATQSAQSASGKEVK